MSASPQVPAGPVKEHRHHLGLEVIAIYKMVKGILLLAAAIGLLRLVNTNVSALVEHWVTVFRMDPDNRYIHRLLVQLTHLDPHKLKAASVGSFIYSALLLTEGVGLWLEQRWAEYLVIFATCSFVPLEFYELARGFNLTKVCVLVINLAIVAYLVRTLRRTKPAQAAAAPPGKAEA